MKKKETKGSLSLSLSLSVTLTWEWEWCRGGWQFGARFRWVVGRGPSRWWVAQPGSGRWCRRSTPPCQCYGGASWTRRRLRRRRAWRGWRWTTGTRCGWPWIWGTVRFPCLGSLAFSLETTPLQGAVCVWKRKREWEKGFYGFGWVCFALRSRSRANQTKYRKNASKGFEFQLEITKYWLIIYIYYKNDFFFKKTKF